MDATIIALISLVVGLIGSVVGAFAWLMGEVRKSSAASVRATENLRDYMNARIDAAVRDAAAERQTMRNDFVSTTKSINEDIRRLAEVMVRRTDVDAMEVRLARFVDRLEQKFDTAMGRMGARQSPGSNSP